MGDELWCRQAQNGVNFDFDLKFDLEGQCWLPPKTIGTLTKVFCIFGPSLVILAWTADELSCRQTWWRTDGQGQRQYPEAKTASGKKLSTLLAFYEENSAVIDGFPHKNSLKHTYSGFCMLIAWTKCWTKSQVAGDQDAMMLMSCHFNVCENWEDVDCV